MLSVKVTRKKRLDPAKFEQAAEQFVETAGVLVAGQAKEEAQVDSGRTRDSITYQTTRSGSEVESRALPRDKIRKPSSKLVALVGTNVEYATHEEYGTRYMAAIPFLRPALDRRRRDMKRLLNSIIGRVFSG